MSLEAAKSFLQKMKDDEDFRKQFAACSSGEQTVELAGTAGFDFTRQELEAAAGELSPEELDRVTGGASQNGVPGVYVNELSAFSTSVIGVETAVPSFIGYTQEDEE